MEEFSLKIEKIAGVASEHSACGVFNKKVTLADGTLGTVVSCILVKCEEEEDAQVVLRDIFELITTKLEGAEGSILAAVCKVSEAMQELVLGRKLEVSFIDTFFYENVCYIAKFGDGVRILVFEPPRFSEIKFEAGSGPIAAGQIYLIATDAFLSIFDSSVLTDNQNIDLEGIIDGLATKISVEDNQSETGAAFVYVRGEELDGVKETGGTKGTEGILQIEDTREIREEEMVEAREEQKVESPSKFKNPLPGFFKIIFGGLSKLQRGDIRAVLALRRNIVVFALVILLILVISVGWTLVQKSRREKIAEFEAHLATASSKYQEGVAIAELNKVRAREILIAADHEAGLALGILNDEKAKKLVSEISAKLKETETTSNVNFEVISEVASPLIGLAISGKNLIGISDDKIFEVETGEKKIREIKSSGNTKGGFVYDERVFILTDDKVYRVDLAGESKKIIEAAGYHDISVFLGNVYLLSGEQIAKFVPLEGGDFWPTDYLNAKEDFGIKGRFAIDGSVWVTARDKIFKFTRGVRQNFEISGLTSKVGEFGVIYTSSQLDNLYVIDSVNSALLVIGKDGIYKRVYQSGEFARTADIVVNPGEKTMYLVSANKILMGKL